MIVHPGKKSASNAARERSDPEGKIKIANALKTLLQKKSFNSITTAEIAKTAGVNEALIYRYYKNKRGLLHNILSQYLLDSELQLKLCLRDVNGTFNKLKKAIWFQFDTYNKNRIFAKIHVIEVRNFPGYFQSETYFSAKKYSDVVLKLVKEGIANGEIRDDIPAWYIMQIILGSCEHLFLPSLIFDREIDIDSCTESICQILLQGVFKVESAS